MLFYNTLFTAFCYRGRSPTVISHSFELTNFHLFFPSNFASPNCRQFLEIFFSCKNSLLFGVMSSSLEIFVKRFFWVKTCICVCTVCNINIFLFQNVNIHRQEYLFTTWPGTHRTVQKQQSGLWRLALPGLGLALPGLGLALPGLGLVLPGLMMSPGWRSAPFQLKWVRMKIPFATQQPRPALKT
jgi:hypothetical protein